MIILRIKFSSSTNLPSRHQISPPSVKMCSRSLLSSPLPSNSSNALRARRLLPAGDLNGEKKWKFTLVSHLRDTFALCPRARSNVGDKGQDKANFEAEDGGLIRMREAGSGRARETKGHRQQEEEQWREEKGEERIAEERREVICTHRKDILRRSYSRSNCVALLCLRFSRA